MPEAKNDETEKYDRAWAVLYRDAAGDLVVVEKYSEATAARLAGKLGGTYQEVDL